MGHKSAQYLQLLIIVLSAMVAGMATAQQKPRVDVRVVIPSGETDFCTVVGYDAIRRGVNCARAVEIVENQAVGSLRRTFPMFQFQRASSSGLAPTLTFTFKSACEGQGLYYMMCKLDIHPALEISGQGTWKKKGAELLKPCDLDGECPERPKLIGYGAEIDTFIQSSEHLKERLTGLLSKVPFTATVIKTKGWENKVHGLRSSLGFELLFDQTRIAGESARAAFGVPTAEGDSFHDFLTCWDPTTIAGPLVKMLPEGEEPPECNRYKLEQKNLLREDTPDGDQWRAFHLRKVWTER